MNTVNIGFEGKSTFNEVFYLLYLDCFLTDEYDGTYEELFVGIEEQLEDLDGDSPLQNLKMLLKMMGIKYIPVDVTSMCVRKTFIQVRKHEYLK